MFGEPCSERGILDAAKRDRIIGLVANGSSRRVAARFVGCSPSTITRTAARDPAFADALARAEETVEVDSLRAIRNAAKTDRYWRAAAWLLERRNPEDYARRGPHLYSATQVAEMFAQALTSLSPQMAETPRLQAMQKLSTLLLEFEEPAAQNAESQCPMPDPEGDARE